MTRPKAITREELDERIGELDDLGIKLVRFKHQWSNDERGAYQRAARSLQEAKRDPTLLASQGFADQCAERYARAFEMLTAAVASHETPASTEPTGDSVDVTSVSPEHQRALDERDEQRARRPHSRLD